MDSSERLHLAFVVGTYAPSTGGVERHVKSLADSLVAQGYRVTVVTLAARNSETDEGGVRVLRIRGSRPIAGVIAFPPVGATRRLSLRLRREGVDVISTHTRFFPMSWVGVRVARRLGVAIIHTEHGSDFVRGVSPLVGVASRLVDLTMGRYVLRSARRVLAVSEDVAAFVRRLSGREANVFYNAIDVDRWRSPAVAPESFAFVGRLVPGKGWDTLFDALVLHARQTGILAQCHVFGHGPQAADVGEAIRRLGLESRVQMRGNVLPEELAVGMRGAILVNPTTLAEGFQTTMLEAVAAGGQVVTYDVPGARVLQNDGAPVWIVEHGAGPLAAGMTDALANPKPAYPADRLDRWGWAARGVEYRGVVEEVTRRGRR